MQLKMIKNQEDNCYIKYKPIGEFPIFSVVTGTEETDIFEVLIAKGQDLEMLQPAINMYMNQLNNCENKLVNYLQNQLGEELPAYWKNDIEVYAASIIFNSIEDYGATISFSAAYVAGGHIIEIYFEKEDIVDSVLIG